MKNQIHKLQNHIIYLVYDMMKKIPIIIGNNKKSSDSIL